MDDYAPYPPQTEAEKEKSVLQDFVTGLIDICEAHAAMYGPKPSFRLGDDMLRTRSDSPSIGWQVAAWLRQELEDTQ